MKKNNLQGIIAARYNNSIAVAKRRNITFNIDEELLERLDSIVADFNSKDNISTRNAVIEDALLAYVEEAEDYFEQMNLKEDKDLKNVNFDTAVFSANNESFNNLFIQQHKWAWVRIAEHRIPHIKYIALYRGAPFSAITHYAEVIRISNANEDNKRIVEIKEPILLDNQIELGNLHVNNVRKLFYTKLEKILSAKTIKDLF